MHKPTMISQSMKSTDGNHWLAEAKVNRHYLLGFGGANKTGLMAEAVEQLNEKYNGFLPYSLTYTTADERKFVFFFVYYKHTLTLKAQLDFKYDGYLYKTTRALKDLNRYGFTTGDYVYGAIGMPFESSTGHVYDLTKYPTGVVTGFDYEQQGFVAKVYVYDKKKTVTVSLENLKLINANFFTPKEGDQVYFNPSGYFGKPLTGKLAHFISNKKIEITLSERSQKAWLALGGKLMPQGSIIAPIHRVYPQLLPTGYFRK